MNLMVFGAPGAGKGTQAQFLTQKYGIPQISTGEILREAIVDRTEMGMKAKKFIDNGKLVPDSTMIGVVKDRLLDDDCKNGFILDGFPRTIGQAKALEKLMKSLGIFLDKVISFDVPENLIIGRITGRRVCPACGASFHVAFHPPKIEDICDSCHNGLIVRKDDNIETVKTRLEAYYTQTAPLLSFYKQRNILLELDGDNNIKNITEEMLEALN